MFHDSGVTWTELFMHFHMQRRHTVLESPSVNLPQRDKDRLLVMSIGGSDVFGPNARNVQEWKKDTEEVRVKLISPSFRRTVEPRQGRQKEAFVVFNTSSSVSLAPVASGCHHIPEVQRLLPEASGSALLERLSEILLQA